ncbi:hypothetical protein EV401DRAFT_1969534 [Pisolithus croceorrhizus]|nr:hypothetical protein EV401DRAFT_1969534 [Pisolithus croceorrhizus]
MTNARKNMSTFFLLLPIAAFEVVHGRKKKEQTNTIGICGTRDYLGRIPACPLKIYLAVGYAEKTLTAFLPEAYRFLDLLSPGGRTAKLIDGRRSTTVVE